MCFASFSCSFTHPQTIACEEEGQRERNDFTLSLQILIQESIRNGLKSVKKIQQTSTKYSQVLIYGPHLSRNAHYSHARTHTRAQEHIRVLWNGNPTYSPMNLCSTCSTMAAKRRPLCCWCVCVCMCVTAIHIHELHANLTGTKLQ